jgi:quercetin dioxygenase-like cupin family protein
MSDVLTVIRHAERPSVTLAGGAAYQPIIGDDTGDGIPIRTGIQTSLPGCTTPLHSHPYDEVLTVIGGRGEAWLDGEEAIVTLEPGMTIVIPANRVDALRVVGDRPLVTFGIHTFGKRIVSYVSPSQNMR